MYAIRELFTIQTNRFKLNKSVLLSLSLVVLYLFVTVGLPSLSKLVGFYEYHQVIIEEKIDAGEWYYIFVEQIREIEPRVTHSLQYAPGMEKADK